MNAPSLTPSQRRALVFVSGFTFGITPRLVRSQAKTRNTGGTLAALVRRGLVERALSTVASLGSIEPVVRCTPAGRTLAMEVAA